MFYSHSTARFKSCKKNNNIAEKDCCPTMKFQQVLDDSLVDRILTFFYREQFFFSFPPTSMGRQLGLFLCPRLSCGGRSRDVDLQIDMVHCLEELVCFSVFLMLRSVLEALTVMLDPQGSNVEVTKQTFAAAMRIWAEKVRNSSEILW